MMIDLTEDSIMTNWNYDKYKKPLVTVKCITYNQEKYIAKAIDGFLSQKTSFPFEVIVHDDASTDKTAEIIREYEKKYPHIVKPIYQKENQYSKGTGIIGKCVSKYIRGKYIALCEGDDYWIDENKLETQIGFMEKNPEYSMTFHPVYYVCNGKKVNDDRICDYECDISTGDIIEGGGMYCATASLCYLAKYEFIRPPFFELADVGDYPRQIFCAAEGKVRYFPKVMGCYRTGHTSSWTARQSQDFEKRVRHYHTEINWLKEFDKEYNYKYTKNVKNRVQLTEFMAKYEINNNQMIKADGVSEAREHAKQISRNSYYVNWLNWLKLSLPERLWVRWKYEGYRLGLIWFCTIKLKGNWR